MRLEEQKAGQEEKVLADLVQSTVSSGVEGDKMITMHGLVSDSRRLPRSPLTYQP